MLSVLEFSTYSYTTNIESFLTCFTMTKCQYTEEIYKKENTVMSVKSIYGKFIITREDIIDKYKNSSYLCKSISKYETITINSYLNNLYYFLNKFGYVLACKKNKVSWIHENEDFCLEIFDRNKENIFFIKLSSKTEEKLNKGVLSLDSFCDFKKPSFLTT